MKLNELGRLQANRTGGFVKVGAEVAAVANGDLHNAWFASMRQFALEVMATQSGFNGCVIDDARIEGDHKRSVGGLNIAQPRGRTLLKPAEELQDALVGRQTDVVAEIDEHGLVTGGAESHALRLTGRIRCWFPGCLPVPP